MDLRFDPRPGFCPQPELWPSTLSSGVPDFALPANRPPERPASTYPFPAAAGSFAVGAEVAAGQLAPLGEVLFSQTFPNQGEAVGQVRHEISRALSDHPDLIDDALLIISELAGNAVRYGGGDAFEVKVSEVLRQILIEVIDTSKALPVLAAALDDAESGRGMFLVDALAAESGAYSTPSGKVVWALLDL